MPAIEIRPDPALSRKLDETLNPRQIRSATFQAVKRTTGKVAGIIQAELQERTVVKTKYIKRVVKTTAATGDPPVGRIRVSQELLPLVAYQAKVTKRGGAVVTVSKDRTPITLRHAFRATVGKGGHRGVFLRARNLPTKGPNEGKGKLTPRGIAGRLAIKEQFGPSVLDLVELPEVLGAIKIDTQAEMAKYLNSQIDRFTKPKPPKA